MTTKNVTNLWIEGPLVKLGRFGLVCQTLGMKEDNPEGTSNPILFRYVHDRWVPGEELQGTSAALRRLTHVVTAVRWLPLDPGLFARILDTGGAWQETLVGLDTGEAFRVFKIKAAAHALGAPLYMAAALLYSGRILLLECDRGVALVGAEPGPAPERYVIPLL